MRIVVEYRRRNNRPVISLWRDGVLLQFVVCLGDGILLGMMTILNAHHTLLESFDLNELGEVAQDGDLYQEYLEAVYG